MAKRPDEPQTRRRPRRQTPAWLRVTGRLTIVGLVLLLTACAGLIAAIPYLQLPDVRGLKAIHAPQSTVLVDAKGRRIAAIHGDENRLSIPLAKMAPMLPKAVVAMEDARFYQHFGVDPIGLARAVVSTLFFRHREGGSTLTQQLAKNLYLTPEQTAKRKIADMLLAVQIERHYTKDQILELYLNQVYWGHGSFGCEAAAMTYFAKHAENLNLAESALLAGILQGPEIFTPYRTPKVAKARQKLVLDRMLGLKFITAQEHKAAWVYPVEIRGIRSSHLAPYFTAYVQALLIDKLGAAAMRTGGYTVTTSLDLDLQRVAENALIKQVQSLRRFKVSQGALICIDPHTGEIKAMVGGMDFAASQFNRAVQAKRQPGSSFKPFVYLTALANGMTPDSVVVDEPMTYTLSDGRTWKPQNYSRRFSGSMTLRTALEQSINIIAVKLAEQVGPERVVATAKACGISSFLQPNLALAMGASEVTPMELCSAYGVLATGGKYTAPLPILKIENAAGNVVVQSRPELKDVFASSPIAALTDMMQGVLLRGTGTAAYFGKPAAGKTGTTSDARDAWFAGFTPDLAAVVWVGNDDNSPMRGMTGGEACAPVWKQFMRVATSSLPARGFPSAPALVGSDVAASPSH
ncbi:MAG: PBP1A family penicillin-binding protein, partial [Candidatus Sericytochromatia bacterium]|nr:PBP1A family penicillin-binding protein [Candidatus Sericytochromatia bacterium]